MATRAEAFRAQQQRTGQAKRKPRHAPTKHSDGVAKGRVPNPASHNEAQRAGRTARYEFEVAQTERPSRKSSRKGLNRQKHDNPLRITVMNRAVTPESRTMKRT